MLKVLRVNLYVFALYWSISHINYMIFHHVGVLPMPFWPAASVAFIASYYNGWRVFPGIASAAIVSNYISLSSGFVLALMISVMNSFGPIISAKLLRFYESSEKLKLHKHIIILFILSCVLMPVLTATGGIFSKYILGLINSEEILAGWSKWAMAHSIGTIVLALPYFIILYIHHSLKGD